MWRIIIFAVCALCFCAPRIALADLILFSDDFSSNTTGTYVWSEEGSGDGNPLNNYSYDAANEWVTVTTANNNNVAMGTSLATSLNDPAQSGYFEFSFMPYKTYHIDGLVQMSLYGTQGTSDRYNWHFARNSWYADPGVDQGYRAHLEKWIDDTPVIEEIFIPSPDHYDLGEWHTLGLEFSPTAISGYLDNQLIVTVTDPASNPIDVGGLELKFQQQDQHVDNISVRATRDPRTIFCEDFEDDLSAWQGKAGEDHHGDITEDPLDSSNNVLTFTELNSAGDIFTTGEAFALDPSQLYEVSFKYLGMPGEGTPGDLGGYAGLSSGFPDSHMWYYGSGSASGALDTLEDNGFWQEYSYEFSVPVAGVGSDLHLMFEDFRYSGGVAGDVYFDDICLRNVTIPAPGAVLLTSIGFGCVAWWRRRECCWPGVLT